MPDVRLPVVPTDGGLDQLALALRELRGAREEIRALRDRMLTLQAERDRATAALVEAEQRLELGSRSSRSDREVSGVAHDINNMLQIVIGRSQLLLNSLAEGDSRRRHAREARRAARFAAALAGQFLGISWPKPRPLHILDSREALEEMRDALEFAVGPDIRLALDPELNGGPIAIDRGNLERIVLNLVLNARDAMPDGGTVSIASRRVPARAAGPVEGRRDGAEASGDFVVISVIDTGVGMDRATRARIFDPYFTTKTACGTGLGLTSAKCIVEAHGGWMIVQSSPGEGSLFEAHLPCAGRGAGEPEPPAVAQLTG